MAFYTGSSLYHTVKSSSSDTSDESASSSSHCNTTALPPSVAPATRIDLAVMNDVKPSRKQESKRESASPTVSPSPGPSSPTVKAPPRKTTETEREVIMTMTLNRKTPREIAESLGLKANTVAKIIERKKKKAIHSLGSEAAQLLARSPPKKR